tara:strand:- start:1957 stop:3615 length:1659 start_codon:yes stop_codon:yes gene_type:complete
VELQEVLSYALPLEGASPVGVDAKHDEDFTALENEIRKGEGIDIKPIDWLSVEVLAGKILKEQSKDLRIASRLTAALFYRHGFNGLSAGFQLMIAMAKSDYWDQLHPARPKSRAASVSWTLQKIDRPFAEYETNLDDAPAVVSAANAFCELDRLLAEKMGDKAPSLFEFRNVINRYKQEAEFLIEKDEKKVEKESLEKAQEESASKVNEKVNQAEPHSQAATSQTSPSSVPEMVAPKVAVPAPTHNPVAVSSSEDIAKALRACNSTMAKVSHLLRGQKISDPYAYFILRSGVWMQLRETPPDNVLPAPMEGKVSSLKLLEQNKDWPALIEECEKTFVSGQVCWLSLHRMTANALDAMSAHDAAQAVKDAVIHLTSRLPEMLTRKFQSGEGFADEMTKAWIASLSPSSVETGEAGTSGESVNTWQVAANDAKKLAISGEFDKGLALFSEGIQSVSSLREQAYWQLEQARFCYDAGHLEIAQPQLTHLNQMMQQKQLQQWEPELHLEVTKLLVNCHTQAQTKKKYTAEQLTHVDQLKAHLCLMDPLGALSIINN